MSFKDYCKNEILPSFFISVTCIALAMGIIGTIFEPKATFGYGILFSPILYGLIAALIQLVGYSKKELTPRQAAVRKIFHVVLLEAGILSILYLGGALTSAAISIALVLSILLIYGAVTLVLWAHDKQTSEAVNRALKVLQDGNRNGTANKKE